jgi:hypothetical protein
MNNLKGFDLTISAHVRHNRSYNLIVQRLIRAFWVGSGLNLIAKISQLGYKNAERHFKF